MISAVSRFESGTTTLQFLLLVHRELAHGFCVTTCVLVIAALCFQGRCWRSWHRYRATVWRQIILVVFSRTCVLGKAFGLSLNSLKQEEGGSSRDMAWGEGRLLWWMDRKLNCLKNFRTWGLFRCSPVQVPPVTSQNWCLEMRSGCSVLQLASRESRNRTRFLTANPVLLV